jgi:DNA-binding NarL/FixJ family response regulator
MVLGMKHAVPPDSNSMSQATPRILFIEPHPFSREGNIAVLSRTLADAVVTGASCLPEAIQLVENAPIDLVVTDFLVLGDTALSLLKALKKRNSATRCLILSASDEIQIGYLCMRAGASGFVRKSAPVPQILEAIRLVLSGHNYLSERLSRVLLDANGSEAQSSLGSQLTTRELQIFSHIGEGMTVAMIAAKLGVSVKTVESHRENIKNKLGLHSSVLVAAAAVRWLDDTSVRI